MSRDKPKQTKSWEELSPRRQQTLIARCSPRVPEHLRCASAARPAPKWALSADSVCNHCGRRVLWRQGSIHGGVIGSGLYRCTGCGRPPTNCTCVPLLEIERVTAGGLTDQEFETAYAAMLARPEG